MFFAALRVTATASVLGAVVAEFLSANAGLGFLVVDSFARFEYVDLWVAISISTMLAMGLFFTTALVEGQAIPWHQSVALKRQRIGE
jgi:NitT/TauT family transport system permease protein